MLIRFGFSNFKSARDYQQITMVASARKERAEPTLLLSSAIDQKLVPVVVIYGANASGKTTVISALARMCSFVKNSHARHGPKSKINRETFVLSSRYADDPTQFDVDFSIDEVRYHYGYEVNDTIVISEWLYAFNGAHRTAWFERSSGNSIKFGRSLRGRNRSIEELTRDNSLFLSAAAQNSHDQLTPIFNYLTEGLRFRIVYGDDVGFSVAKNKSTIDPRIVEFLKYADTGIVSARLEEVASSPSAKKFVEGMRSLFKESLSEISEDSGNDIDFDVEINEVNRRVELGHLNDESETIFFSLDRESRGTAKLIGLMTDVFDAIDSGSVLLIDELDNSLHTILAAELIKIFSSDASNPHGAQIVATTHDTNLMQLDVLRRDQIWLCEKDGHGASHTFPLTDISVRQTDNLEKGYLQGRFGAIPFMGVERMKAEI